MNHIIKRNFILSLFLVLTSLFTGCSQPTVNAKYINLQQDGSFLARPISQSVLVGSTADLDRRVGDEIIYSNDGDARNVSIKYGNLDKDVLGLTSCDLNNNQCDITISLIVNPDQYPDPVAQAIMKSILEEVLLHEIGHSFGFGHFADPTHIMYKYENTDNIKSDRFQVFAENLNSFRNDGDKTGFPTLESGSAGDTLDPNDSETASLIFKD